MGRGVKNSSEIGCGRRKKDQTPRTEPEKARIEIEQLKHKLYLAEMECDLARMIHRCIHYYNTQRVQCNPGILTTMEKHALCLAA